MSHGLTRQQNEASRGGGGVSSPREKSIDSKRKKGGRQKKGLFRHQIPTPGRTGSESLAGGKQRGEEGSVQACGRQLGQQRRVSSSKLLGRRPAEGSAKEVRDVLSMHI